MTSESRSNDHPALAHQNLVGRLCGKLTIRLRPLSDHGVEDSEQLVLAAPYVKYHLRQQIPLQNSSGGFGCGKSSHIEMPLYLQKHMQVLPGRM